MSDVKEQKLFFCKDHGRALWETDEYVLENDIYFSKCPVCGQPCKEVGYRHKNLMKAWSHASGPKTQAGKERSRLNGFKHGKYTSVYHELAPALPGRFPMCKECEYFDDCKSKKWSWCPVNLDPMMRMLKAFKEGKISDLKEFAAINQTKAFNVLQLMFAEIFDKGTLAPKELRRKVNATDDEETVVLEWQENPLIKRLPAIFEMLGHTADQQTMTPEKNLEGEAVAGFLGAVENEKQSLEQFRLESAKKIESIKSAVMKGNINTKQDPAFKEYAEQIEFEEVKARDKDS
jgi:hypothetical protein